MKLTCLPVLGRPINVHAMKACPVCKSPADIEFIAPPGPDRYSVDCTRCGRFKLSGTLKAMLLSRIKSGGLAPEQAANMSGYIRHNQGQAFNDGDIGFLCGIRTPTASEKIMDLLRFIAKQHPYPGQTFRNPLATARSQSQLVSRHTGDDWPDDDTNCIVACREGLPYLSACWARDAEELAFCLARGLRDADLIEDADGGKGLRITPTGWRQIESLDAPAADSQTAFVAMWFHDLTSRLWSEAIRPGVYAAGYEPLRIDQVEHVNRIDDEILAGIRRSKFIVADFTGNRGGVYFEAGFGLGMGRRVVWCVRHDRLKKVHFDNRQYNFLSWDPKSLPAFRDRLQFRIEALFGKGPLRQAAGS